MADIQGEGRSYGSQGIDLRATESFNYLILFAKHSAINLRKELRHLEYVQNVSASIYDSMHFIKR